MIKEKNIHAEAIKTVKKAKQEQMKEFEKKKFEFEKKISEQREVMRQRLA